MKTAITSPNPARDIPPLAVVLLLLALLFSFAAWRTLKINRNIIPSRPSPPMLSKELSASDSNRARAAYQAHRHQAVPLGSGSSTARVIQANSGGPISKGALL